MRLETEELPAKREVVFFGAVGEKAEMADADESGGKRVEEEEAPNKFFGGQGHDLALVAVSAILPRKGDDSVFDVEDAVVGNGDAMGIAAQVIEDLLGSAERRLGVDDPWFFIAVSYTHLTLPTTPYV